MNSNNASAERRLRVPTMVMLPRIADSLSFLYIDIARIVQDDTGVCAEVQSARGIDRVYIPTAAVTCLLLGPGTSITARALSTLARHGTTVSCVGSGVVRCYAAITPDSQSTAWLERQVHAWSDDDRRLQVATRMYAQRFGETPPPGTSLAQLRGLEGQRMKALYKILAERHHVRRFRRSYDRSSWDQQDPVNLALSAASACLYGVTHAALIALGCSPALGFVHTGTQHAFVYDIADLYKARITVPLAFSLHDSTMPERDVRRKLREQFRLLKLLPQIVTDVQRLLAPDEQPDDHDVEPADVELTSLWDPRTGPLPGGINYGDGIF